MKVWLHSTEELRNSFQFDENFLRTIFIFEQYGVGLRKMKDLASISNKDDMTHLMKQVKLSSGTYLAPLNAYELNTNHEIINSALFIFYSSKSLNVTFLSVFCIENSVKG